MNKISIIYKIDYANLLRMQRASRVNYYSNPNRLLFENTVIRQSPQDK